MRLLASVLTGFPFHHLHHRWPLLLFPPTSPAIVRGAAASRDKEDRVHECLAYDLSPARSNPTVARNADSQPTQFWYRVRQLLTFCLRSPNESAVHLYKQNPRRCSICGQIGLQPGRACADTHRLCHPHPPSAVADRIQTTNLESSFESSIWSGSGARNPNARPSPLSRALLFVTKHADHIFAVRDIFQTTVIDLFDLSMVQST